MYQRYEIWLRAFSEALSNLGLPPAQEAPARSFYAAGDSPEEAARYLLEVRQALEAEDEE